MQADKWTASELGPRQAKAFNQAISQFSWVAKTKREQTDHGIHEVTEMFGGSWQPGAAETLAAIREKYNATVTGKNYAAIVADIGAATVKLRETMPVIDKRTTPEQRAERERIAAEHQAKQQAEAARIAAMQTHTYSLAETSAAIKRVLVALFPGTSFSVRSESYSMGCSIDAHWTDGPTEKQVKPVLDIFERCGFDGMQDLKTYNATPEWNGHRFEFHGDYVRGARSVSAAMLREAAERFTRETGMEAPRIVEDGRYCYAERGTESCGWSFWTHQEDEYPDGVLCKDDARYNDAASIVQQIAGHTSKAQLAIAFVTDWPEGEPEPDNSVRAVVFRLLLGETSNATEARSEQAGVTVTENDEKDGVEIRFDAKPAADVLERLKANGWRWSRFSHCWYHKRTPQARAFADTLAAVAV